MAEESRSVDRRSTPSAMRRVDLLHRLVRDRLELNWWQIGLAVITAFSAFSLAVFDILRYFSDTS
jgi:hypothetical protein